jgi:Holliday junction resolvasome RuvABC endonuclease subunit
MSVLTLDLGSTTGFMLKCRGGAVLHGFWSLKGGRSEGAGMRYLRFRSCLGNLHTNSHIRYVAFEDVRRHNGTDAAHVFGGLRAVLMAWCEENTIPYEGVSVQAIKKFVTGKGNAGKPQVIAAVRKHGFEGVVDENEADAVALMLLKLEDPVVRDILAI